jgi:hypothetical protein
LFAFSSHYHPFHSVITAYILDPDPVFNVYRTKLVNLYWGVLCSPYRNVLYSIINNVYHVFVGICGGGAGAGGIRHWYYWYWYYHMNDLLDNLNSNVNFDFKNSATFLFENDDWPNPYLDINIDSKFFDNDTFVQSYANYAHPIFISINIQSLK